MGGEGHRCKLNSSGEKDANSMSVLPSEEQGMGKPREEVQLGEDDFLPFAGAELTKCEVNSIYSVTSP